MSLLDVVRDGIAFANHFTIEQEIQTKVQYERFLSETGAGDRNYAAAVWVDAIVIWKQQQVRTAGGELAVSRASVTFLDPSIVVQDEDRITLQDGTTGPILDMAGPIDRGTGHPLLTEVFLG